MSLTQFLSVSYGHRLCKNLASTKEHTLQCNLKNTPFHTVIPTTGNEFTWVIDFWIQKKDTAGNCNLGGISIWWYIFCRLIQTIKWLLIHKFENITKTIKVSLRTNCFISVVMKFPKTCSTTKQFKPIAITSCLTKV